MGWIRTLLGWGRTGLSFVGGLIGPKVFAATVAVLVAGMAFLWWRYQDAVGDAAEARQAHQQAVEAANHNAEMVEAAQANTRRLAELYREREQRRKEAARQAAKLREELQEAKEDAPEEVRRCFDVRLPGGILNSLRRPAARQD